MFCPRCGNQYEGKPVFCATCGLRLDQGQSLGRSWFQSHLNWTLVIALVAINVASFVLVDLAYFYIVAGAAGGVAGLIVIGNVILTAIVGGWALNQKGTPEALGDCYAVFFVRTGEETKRADSVQQAVLEVRRKLSEKRSLS